MRITRRVPAAILALLMSTAAGAAERASTAGDGTEAVRAAALGYVDMFYLADRSIYDATMWDEFQKIGFYRAPGSDTWSAPQRMTPENALGLIDRWADGDNPTRADAPREVIVFEVTDQTASVRVNAWWGFDYLHLAKIDEQWRVVNVLWQSYPAER